MKTHLTLLVLAIAMGSAAITRAADSATDNAANAFEQLYGLRVRSVLATADKADDVALAGELLAAAKSSTEAPALLALMTHKAYDLGAKHADGYATAIAAMDLLARHAPDQRDAANEKAISLLQRAVSRARGDARDRFAGQLLRRRLALADAHAAAGRYDDAVAAYRRALADARTVRSDQADAIRGRLDAVMRRQRLDKRVQLLKVSLEAEPTNAPAAEQLVRLYVVDMDRPAAAKLFLAGVKDAGLKRHTTLAMKAPGELTKAEALTLSEWYRGLAQSADASARPAMLNRAWTYLKRFLALHTTRDVQHVTASLRLKEVAAAMTRLGVQPYPLSTEGAAAAPVGPAVPPVAGAPQDLIKLAIQEGLKTGRKPATRGSCSIQDRVVHVNRHRDMAWLQLGVGPTDAYRLTVRFTRTEGDDAVYLLLPVGASRFAVALDHATAGSGISRIHEQWISSPGNPTRTSAFNIINNRVHTAVVEVRPRGEQADITVQVDGRPLIRWTGKQSDLSLYGSIALPSPNGIGVGALRSSARFSRVMLEPVFTQH